MIDRNGGPLSDGELVEAFLIAIRDLSLHEADAETGISYGTISRFRRGDWKRVQPATRRQMRDYLARWNRRLEEEDRAREESPESAVYDPGEVEDERPGVGEEEIVRMPQVVRHLKTFDHSPDPQMMKLAAVRAWGEILSLNGGWPEWYIALRAKVERGEL